MTDQTKTWELGDTPGECAVSLGSSGKLVGIQCGGPDNAVLFPAWKALAVASALMEAAGEAGQSTVAADLTATRSDMASVRVVLREAAKQGRGMTLNATAVQALATMAEQGTTRLKPGQVVDPIVMERSWRALALLQDLDRCGHGRHSTDSCLDCPGGQSLGNRELDAGTVIGFDRAGQEIVAPSQADRGTPEAWRLGRGR